MDSLQRGLGISRSGRVPTWLVLSLGAAALFCGVELLGERLYAQGYTHVDMHCVKIEVLTEEFYVPPEWSEFVAVRTADLGHLSVDDPEEVAQVVEALKELPFIRSVGEPRVIWPNGIEVEVRLRRPVACISIGSGFRLVSEDGVVLPGFSVSPPHDGVAPFPLVAWDDSLGDLAAGDLFPLDKHFAAVSVALSMQDCLKADEDRSLLGSIRIDADRADLASVEEPGVRIYLEGSREVWFGRSLLGKTPGEMPAEEKWRHLVRHLREPSEGGREWAVLDVRFDRAQVRRWKEKK